MPRKSAAELSIATPAEIGKLPEPPAELTEYQAAIWHSVVATKPVDWFQADSFPLLVSFCKHVSAAAVIDQAIDSFQPKWLDTPEGVVRLEKLSNIRSKHTGRIESLATKMRLTQQSRYDTIKAAGQNRKAAKGKQPWES